MIRLIGVIGKGGVPVKLRTFADIESTTVIGSILEVLKGLSTEMQLGQVRRLEFNDNIFLVSESQKGYTVIALVDKATTYFEELVRIIAQLIDDSAVSNASETINEELIGQIDSILNALVKDQIDIQVPKVVKEIWNPLLDVVIRDGRFAQSLADIDRLVQEAKSHDTQWDDFTAKVKGDLTDAVRLALEGKFDTACAISIKLEDPLAQLFAVKLGLLALTTTRTLSPPLYKLRRIAETLPLKYRPFAELAYASTLYLGRFMSFDEYAKVYQSTATKFTFKDKIEDLIFAFLFIDTKVVTIPEFATKLMAFFEDKSPILTSYIQAMIERDELFTKLYSVTSYSEFKDQVSVWKDKIKTILADVNLFLKPGFLKKLLKRKPAAGIRGSLNLGTYIALYTALAESPVLNLKERKEVLEEVWQVYSKYFRKLLESDLPLFSYTIDSIFQSVSVVLAETYSLLSVQEQPAHIHHMVDFLQDIFRVLTEEWIREHEDISTIFVMTNAIFPTLFAANVLPDEEIRLCYLAMRLLNVKDMEKQQHRDAVDFVTDLGNLKSTLAALTANLIRSDERNQLIIHCVKILVDVHKFFLTHGLVCRDDVIIMTRLAAEIVDVIDHESLSDLLTSLVVINRIVITDYETNDSDVAVMSIPLIDFLVKAWQRLNDESLHKLASKIYEVAIQTWQKYGFTNKVSEMQKLYSDVLGRA